MGVCSVQDLTVLVSKERSKVVQLRGENTAPGTNLYREDRLAQSAALERWLLAGCRTARSVAMN